MATLEVRRTVRTGYTVRTHHDTRRARIATSIRLLYAILAAPSHQLRAAILHREHALRPADRAEVAAEGEARALLERPLARQAAPG